MSLPYFPFFPTDFAADTKHLTRNQVGVYMSLLIECWDTPSCSIPNDVEWILDHIMSRRDNEDLIRADVIVVKDEFFKVKKGRIYQKKLLEVFNQQNDKHKSRVSAGKKGGQAKSLKTNKIVSSNATAKLKQPEPEPEPELKDDYHHLQKSDEEVEFLLLCDAVFFNTFPNGSIGTGEVRREWFALGLDVDKQIIPTLANMCKAAKAQPVSWRYFDATIKSLAGDGKQRARDAMRERNSRLVAENAAKAKDFGGIRQELPSYSANNSPEDRERIGAGLAGLVREMTN